MQTVLVPFDGSASAKRAIHYLVDFSRRYPDIKVHILNVQAEPTLFGDYASLELLKQLRGSALSQAVKVNSAAAETLRAAEIAFETHERVGEIIPEVLRAINAYECDTVVMGTRGMNSLANLVMGSIATRVVHQVSVPVLLVK